MEIHLLRTFAEVADTGHLTRAAEKLNLSQPAVSAHIKGLEEMLGLRLFDRSPAGMVLTRAGAQLRQQAEEVIGAMKSFRHLAAALKGKIAGRLRVGTLSDPDF